MLLYFIQLRKAAQCAAAPRAAQAACGGAWHCTAARPILEKLAQALGWTVPVYYVDAEGRPGLAQSLNVTSYPTIFFANNDGLFKYAGERTYEGLMGFVCEHSSRGNYEFCSSPLAQK
jgi:thioredoxin-like negative regulator of GroEL